MGVKKKLDEVSCYEHEGNKITPIGFMEIFTYSPRVSIPVMLGINK